MSALFKNNATALLAASISTSGTTLVLAAGTGSKFPSLTGSDFFYGTLYDSSGNYEIVKVTARASDSLTIVRAQEGTTALAFSSGNAFAQRLTAAGLNDFAQKSAAQTFSGNNTNTGTNTYSGSDTFSGTFAAANPTFTGTVTIPTPTTGDSTTKAASTAFVTSAITTATGSLGTMATQNKTAVDITGGTIVGITNLAVADGGTGRSTLTDKAVLIGAGTGGITSISPGILGNVLKSDGTNWISAANAAPSILYNQQISENTTYTVSLTASNRPVQIFMGLGAIQGGNTYISITFEWGIGSLTNSYQPVSAGVNYVVYPCPSLTTFVTPSSASTLYFRISTTNLSVQGAFASIIQL
jgi:hypothetical protein